MADLDSCAVCGGRGYHHADRGDQPTRIDCCPCGIYINADLAAFEHRIRCSCGASEYHAPQRCHHCARALKGRPRALFNGRAYCSDECANTHGGAGR